MSHTAELDTCAASLRDRDAVQSELQVQRDRGLSDREVRSRQEQFGLNRLQEAKTRSTWAIFIDQFKSPIVALLGIAAVLSFAFQEWIEGIAVTIAIALNAAIGFFTEIQAVQSMESLKQLSKTRAKVRRNGEVCEVPAEELVPGDIVLLESGDVISADLRVLEASKMQVDESALTGESVPVSKSSESLAEERPIADRHNTLFKGTALTRGSGEGVVIATGTGTELGRISELTAEAEEEVTPLEKRLDKLGRSLIWLTLGISVLVAIAGILGGRDLVRTIETAIALAVAAVPEGLPIVATVALARGMWRMARRNALINRLSAVETLGATNIICTDKTGTLTENRMTVRSLALPGETVTVSGEGLTPEGEFRRDETAISPDDDPVLFAALEIGVLCNNASLPEDEDSPPVGDPMEVALLVAGAKAGLRRDAMLETTPERREVAFDSDTKMMATYHERSDNSHSANQNGQSGLRVAVKGAPESVLPCCTTILTAEGTQEMDESRRQDWSDRIEAMARDGLRVLALAQKTVSDPDSKPYEELVLVGALGLLDPPREAAKQAIAACHDAGIRAIMVTGDQPITARNVGLAVGLTREEEAEAERGDALKSLEDLSDAERDRLVQIPVFARVSPEQKLNPIALHQADRDVVAMTGDGVNDAPALKKADIGVAMGKRGTQVACEAADMVLQDDAFATIIAAIAQGRAIFGNIRKFTVYLLSGNAGEIFAVAIASLTAAPLPLLPLQILFLNVINDVFPALALGVGEGNAQLMKQPPRDPGEPILDRPQWWAIGGYGVLIGAIVLGIFWVCLQPLQLPSEQAITVSFLGLAFARLWHVFNMRDPNSPLIRNEITTNPYVWGALVLCTGLLLLSVYVPPIATVLQVQPPTARQWWLIAGTSLLPVAIGQIILTFESSATQRKLRR